MPTSPIIELIRCPQLAADVPYAYASVASAVSRLVFTAGACPLDASGKTIAAGDVATQAAKVMENLEVALAAAGAALSDVVKTTVYVATQRQADLLVAWDVVRRHFGDHDVPNTLLGVSVLGWANQLVEVEAVAVR